MHPEEGADGTGIGLAVAVAERIVSGLGGRRGVDVGTVDGARFCFALPDPDGPI